MSAQCPRFRYCQGGTGSGRAHSPRRSTRAVNSSAMIAGSVRYLVGAGVGSTALHPCHCPSVPVGGPHPDGGHLSKAQRGQACFAGGAERLTLFWCVDLCQANNRSRLALRRQGVAIAHPPTTRHSSTGSGIRRTTPLAGPSAALGPRAGCLPATCPHRCRPAPPRCACPAGPAATSGQACACGP